MYPARARDKKELAGCDSKTGGGTVVVYTARNSLCTSRSTDRGVSIAGSHPLTPGAFRADIWSLYYSKRWLSYPQDYLKTIKYCHGRDACVAMKSSAGAGKLFDQESPDMVIYTSDGES